MWIDRLCDLVVSHEPLVWLGEAGPIRRGVEPFLLRRMRERKAQCRFEWLPSVTDKPTRARSIQALASMGQLWVPAHASWRSELIGQALRFPAGRYDDGVDVLSLIGRGLKYLGAAQTPVTVNPIGMMIRGRR